MYGPSTWTPSSCACSPSAGVCIHVRAKASTAVRFSSASVAVVARKLVAPCCTSKRVIVAKAVGIEVVRRLVDGQPAGVFQTAMSAAEVG